MAIGKSSQVHVQPPTTVLPPPAVLPKPVAASQGSNLFEKGLSGLLAVGQSVNTGRVVAEGLEDLLGTRGDCLLTKFLGKTGSFASVISTPYFLYSAVSELIKNPNSQTGFGALTTAAQLLLGMACPEIGLALAIGGFFYDGMILAQNKNHEPVSQLLLQLGVNLMTVLDRGNRDILQNWGRSLNHQATVAMQEAKRLSAQAKTVIVEHPVATYSAVSTGVVVGSMALRASGHHNEAHVLEMAGGAGVMMALSDYPAITNYLAPHYEDGRLTVPEGIHASMLRREAAAGETHLLSDEDFEEFFSVALKGQFEPSSMMRAATLRNLYHHRKEALTRGDNEQIEVLNGRINRVQVEQDYYRPNRVGRRGSEDVGY